MYYEIIKELNILKYGADKQLVQSVLEGDFVITGGTISLPSALIDGQHIVIEGSAVNDGAYVAPISGLTDESFSGKIYILRKNADFEALVGEIEEWQDKYGAASAGPYQSESFAGYSYTKASSASASASTSWKTAFAQRLRPWRKI